MGKTRRTHPEPNMDASKADRVKVRAVIDRLIPLLKEDGRPLGDRLDWEMDLVAVHCNGIPLDLDRMLKADERTLRHDLYGIRRFIDRETGKLREQFLPKLHGELPPDGDS